MSFTIEEIKEKFAYDPKTGVITNKQKKKGIRVGDQVGSVIHHGYVRVSWQNGSVRKSWLAHRIAWAIMTDNWPPGEIGHINGNRSDNRWDNLQAVTRTEVTRNAKLSSANKSGLKGVSRCKWTDKWRANIFVDGRQVWLGRHDSLDEAIAARKAANIKYGRQA